MKAVQRLTDEEVEDDVEGESGRRSFGKEAGHVRQDDATHAVQEQDQANGTWKK